MLRCNACRDTGWVCEIHPNRPWTGTHGCGCGATGTPCPDCNETSTRFPDVTKVYRSVIDVTGKKVN